MDFKNVDEQTDNLNEIYQEKANQGELLVADRKFYIQLGITKIDMKKLTEFDRNASRKGDPKEAIEYLDDLIQIFSNQQNKMNESETIPEVTQDELFFIKQLKGVHLLKAGKTQEGIDLLNELSLEINKTLTNPEKFLLNSNIFYLIGYVAKLAKKNKEALGFLLRSQEWRIWLIGDCLVKLGLLNSIPKVCDETLKRILFSGNLQFSPLIIDLMQGLALTWKHIADLDERLTKLMQLLSDQFYDFVEKEREIMNKNSKKEEEEKINDLTILVSSVNTSINQTRLYLLRRIRQKRQKLGFQMDQTPFVLIVIMFIFITFSIRTYEMQPSLIRDQTFCQSQS